jgi:heptosyltransferase-1
LEFPLESPATTVVNEIRDVLRIAPRETFVTVNPGAAWPNKRWPADRFGAVARALRERTGLRSIVVWGSGERQLAEQVVGHSGGSAALAPATTLADLIAIADASALTVSGDTGPLHIAAARGCRVVALFGPTNPHRNGPWNVSDRVVSRYDECRCHYKRRCHVRDWCLGKVPVEEVVAAASDRLAERPGGGMDPRNPGDAAAGKGG